MYGILLSVLHGDPTMSKSKKSRDPSLITVKYNLKMNKGQNGAIPSDSKPMAL